MAWTTFVPASSVAVTLTNGNLTATATATTASTRSEDTIQFGSNNKLYFEVTLNSTPNATGFYGVAASGYVSASNLYCGVTQGGTIYINGASTGLTIGTAFAASDVVCCAIDLQHGLAWFRKNAGNWNNVAANNRATGVGGASIPPSMAAFLVPFALWRGQRTSHRRLRRLSFRSAGSVRLHRWVAYVGWHDCPGLASGHRSVGRQPAERHRLASHSLNCLEPSPPAQPPSSPSSRWRCGPLPRRLRPW